MLVSDVDVGQQREVQQLVLGERLHGERVVDRDPDPVGAGAREAGREVPEVDRLPRAAAGPGGREEEQDDRSTQQHLVQLLHLAVLVGEVEVGRSRPAPSVFMRWSPGQTPSRMV